MKRVALYPGSFDPMTNGHLSIIHRGLKSFDGLIVAIANNSKKTPLFSVDERKEMILSAIGHDPRVEMASFEGLMVDYAKKRGISIVLRGLRAVSDFEYEFQLANMNRKLESHRGDGVHDDRRGLLLHLLAARSRGGVAGRQPRRPRAGAGGQGAALQVRRENRRPRAGRSGGDDVKISRRASSIQPSPTLAHHGAGQGARGAGRRRRLLRRRRARLRHARAHQGRGHRRDRRAGIHQVHRDARHPRAAAAAIARSSSARTGSTTRPTRSSSPAARSTRSTTSLQALVNTATRC